MTLNRIIEMIITRMLRRVVAGGHGANAQTGPRGGKAAKRATPDHDVKAAAKRLRQTARMMRRIGRF